jgi:Flp pilus assembly protein TadG
MMRISNRRNGERGQILVVIAVMALVLIGSTALAVDLGVNTQSKRNLQNMTDPAALAGARDLPLDPKQGLKDALDAVEKNSPWAGNTSWLTTGQSSPVLSCNATRCTISSYAGPSGYSNYSISLSSPPASPQNSNYNTTNYIEVDVRLTSTNGFAGAIGIGTSSELGHSIAYSPGPSGAFPFALWSKTQVLTGNEVEQIIGNTYAAQAYVDQSTGKAGLCANELADGTQGYAMLGSPQVPDTNSGAVQYNQNHVNTITPGKDCSWAVNNQPVVAQQQPQGCPSGISSYVDSSFTKACVAQPALLTPSMPAPTLVCPLPCVGTTPIPNAWCKNPPTTWPQGIYTMDSTVCNGANGLDFSGNGASYTLNCVTLYFPNGGNMTVSKNSDSVTQTPFGPGCSDFSAARPPNPNDGKYAIYAPAGSAPTITIQQNTDTYTATGTVYMPDGTVSIGQNCIINITGQAVVGTWNVQSGNHPNPDVTYSASVDATTIPALRLTE